MRGRFVRVRSENNQAAGLAFKARDLLVRQRTQIINALRGHLSEFGFVVAKGPTHVRKLVSAVEDGDIELPEISRPLLSILVDTLEALNVRIRQLEARIAQPNTKCFANLSYWNLAVRRVWLALCW